MRLQHFVLLAGLSFSTFALSQADPDVSYDGNWSATVSSSDGARHGSRLVLSRFAGTWYGPIAGSNGSCKAKKAQVTVQESSATRLAFTVWGKTNGAQCGDLSVQLTPTAENVLEGTIEAGGSIKLVRRQR